MNITLTNKSYVIHLDKKKQLEGKHTFWLSSSGFSEAFLLSKKDTKVSMVPQKSTSNLSTYIKMHVSWLSW